MKCNQNNGSICWCIAHTECSIFVLQASHVGKVVVAKQSTGLAPCVSDRATVAITGGLGGLGLLVARWLVGTGEVGNIHLVSRSGRFAVGTEGLPDGSACITAMVRIGSTTSALFNPSSLHNK